MSQLTDHLVKELLQDVPHVRPLKARIGRYPVDQVVKAPAPAGSVALFHALTLHYSGPNRSAVSRHGPIIQYFAQSPTLSLRAYPPDTPFGEQLVWSG